MGRRRGARRGAQGKQEPETLTLEHEENLESASNSHLKKPNKKREKHPQQEGGTEKNKSKLPLLLRKGRVNREAPVEEARQQRRGRGSPPRALQTQRSPGGVHTDGCPRSSHIAQQKPQPSLQSPSMTEISRPTWFYRVQTLNEETMLILHNLIQKREGIIPSLAREASIALEKKQMRTEKKQNPHTRVPHDRKHHQQNTSKLRPPTRGNGDSQGDLPCDVGWFDIEK